MNPCTERERERERIWEGMGKLKEDKGVFGGREYGNGKA